MDQPPADMTAKPERSATFRFDIVAGLTAAAVVLPKAMAYATVAGLPVAVGLYTAFVPMVIYALLGSSRVLSVSSTTTLAILTGTELGLVVPDGDPAMLVTATATLTALVGAMLLLARLMRLGFRRQLHFRAGADRLQGRDRPRDRAGPGAEAAGHPHHQAGILRRSPQRRAARSRDVADHARGGRRDVPRADRNGSACGRTLRRRWSRSAAASPRRGSSACRHWGVSTVGLIPQGFPSLTLPDPALIEQLVPGALGIALMSFTETIAVGRAFARPGDPPIDANRELIATGAANLGGALLGAMPAGGGTSQTAVVRAAGGRSQMASLVTAGVAVATMLLLAPLLGLLPHATLAAIVIVYSVGLIQPAEFRAIRKVRTMEFRWAVVAALGVLMLGTLEGIVVAIIVSLIGLASQSRQPARVRHRPQARRRCAATLVAGTPGRRDVRGPADRAAGGAPLFRQRARMWRSRSTR